MKLGEVFQILYGPQDIQNPNQLSRENTIDDKSLSVQLTKSS